MLAVFPFFFVVGVLLVGALGWAVWWSRMKTYLAEAAYRAAVAEKVLRDQGMLVNEVAHELKNPVTAIVCAAQTLEMLLDRSLDMSQRVALRHIKEHGEYVLSLMQDFIDVTRGVSGHLYSNKEQVVVSGPLRAVVGMVEPIAARKKISLELRGCEELLEVSIDPKHLKQIVFNLLHNAVKFAPSNSKVSISVERVQVSPLSTGPAVRIAVCDNGPGISPERLKTIFNAAENFKARSVEDGGRGCGLGLPLTKTLVDLEGGAMRLTSNECSPGGTTAELFFNAVVNEQHRVERVEEESLSNFPLAGQRVLVVEDDPHVRDAVSGLIRALGGAVDGVGEAISALEAVQKTSYSAVVIDEYIGGLSAGDVAMMIKEQPGAGDVRFVVTGSGESVDGNVSSKRDVLQKPFDRKTLVESLTSRPS